MGEGGRVEDRGNSGKENAAICNKKRREERKRGKSLEEEKEVRESKVETVH